MARQKALLMATAALLVTMSTAAQAQDAPVAAGQGDGPATSQADGTDAGSSGDIVVTALKRSQALQEVPASISAVSGDALAEKGLSDIRDISKVVPNLSWGEHFGTTLITIRGAGSNVDSGATEPTVAIYVDGIYLPRSDMATFRAVDLERVEVLRGPQGTLYGRNATGGAVNLISQAPTKTLTGKVTLSTGSRNEIGVSGYVSGPLSDAVTVRLSGGREKQDGYVRVENTGQKLNGVDTRYGRLAVAIEPVGSGVRDEVSVRYERNSAAVGYQQPLGPMVFPASTYTSQPNRLLADYPYSGERETFIASNQLTWEASDAFTIRSLTGYINHNSHAQVDADGSLLSFQYVPDFVRTSKSFSQELNFIGTAGRLDYIVGLYYFSESYYGNLPVALGADLAPALGLPTGATINLGQSAKVRNYAAFTDLTYAISDRVKLNVGLRLNHEDNKFRQIFSLTPVVPEFSADLPRKETKLIPKVALNADLTDDVHTYLQWSKGYKSGGTNLPGGGGTILPLYRPENISAFEAGVKSQFLDRRVTFNAAAWYYDYSGLQITRNVPPSTTQVENADARIYGIEAEMRFEPIDRLELTVAPTWQHARFRDFSTFDPIVAATLDLDGGALPRAPNFTVNAGIANRFDLGGSLLSSLRLEANVLHSSTVVLRYENTDPLARQKPYNVVNFSASLSDASRKTQLTFFLNNAFNEIYKQQSLNFGIGYMGNYGPPRTFGVRLSREL